MADTKMTSLNHCLDPGMDVRFGPEMDKYAFFQLMLKLLYLSNFGANLAQSGTKTHTPMPVPASPEMTYI